MDTWYGVKYLMDEIDKLGKIFYTAIRSNRLVSRVDKKYNYIPASTPARILKKGKNRRYKNTFEKISSIKPAAIVSHRGK